MEPAHSDEPEDHSLPSLCTGEHPQALAKHVSFPQFCGVYFKSRMLSQWVFVDFVSLTHCNGSEDAISSCRLFTSDSRVVVGSQEYNYCFILK